MVNIIGWIGNIFFIIGCWLLAKKRIEGFYFNSGGNVAYATIGIIIKTNSIWFISLWLLGLNIYGIYKWRKK